MSIHKLLTVLTVANLVLLAYLLSNVQPAGAIDPNGKPIVKLAGAVGSAGLGLNDGSDTTYALIEAKDADSYVRLTTSDGRRQIIKP